MAAPQELFRHGSDDLGLAHVVILHLSPDQPSVPSEVLARRTRMPVCQVNDCPTPQPGHVHVIAPDDERVIDGDQVSARPSTPIDRFFRVRFLRRSASARAGRPHPGPRLAWRPIRPIASVACGRTGAPPRGYEALKKSLSLKLTVFSLKLAPANANIKHKFVPPRESRDLAAI